MGSMNVSANDSNYVDDVCEATINAMILPEFWCLYMLNGFKEFKRPCLKK